MTGSLCLSLEKHLGIVVAAPATRDQTDNPSALLYRQQQGEPRSMRSAHSEDNRHSLEEDKHISREGPVSNIRSLETNDLLEVSYRIATIHLPRAGDSGLHIESRVMMRLVEGDLRWQRWPWAHKRHPPLQHIEKLRPLLQAGPTQPGTEASHPGVADNLEQSAVRVDAVLQKLFPMLFGVRYHRSEFDNREQPAAASHAILAEEHRAGGVEFHKQRDQQHYRRRHNQTKNRPNQVHGALDDHLAATERRRGELDQRLITAPHKSRLNASDSDATRYREDFASCGQCGIDDIVKPRVTEISADYDRLRAGFVHHRRKVDDVAYRRWRGRDVRVDKTDRPVLRIKTECGACRSLPTLFSRTDEERIEGGCRTRPNAVDDRIEDLSFHHET